MRKLTAALSLTLASIAIAVGGAAPASAATKNPITSLKVAYGDACGGDEATVVTSVKLRKGHNVSYLATDLYAGKQWIGSRTDDVKVSGKTSVKFATCVPNGVFNYSDGMPRTNLRWTVTTMPRSRYTKSVRLPIYGD